MSPQKMMREVRQLGWQVKRTNGGHLICRHPDAAYAVYGSSTPSDKRSILNLKAKLRRSLREGATK